MSILSNVQKTPGLQAYINPTDAVLTPTTGTPGAGTFYSSITNRASLIDLTQDLKVRMGVDRMMVQQLQQVPNEFGPNGEIVWANPNDQFGQMRFIGGWSIVIDANGVRPVNLSASGTLTDALEITFYGTGLNILAIGGSSNFTGSLSVDGGSESAFTINYAAAIIGRNYATNQVIPVVSGLSLGVHTVKIRRNTVAASTEFHVYGFEVLNISANVITNPGSSYIAGQKVITASQSTIAYNNAVTGTNGGRVLQYQAIDGTIAQAFQAVNASPAYLASADHTNEEVARTYFWREFGAGRSDDFSSYYSTGGSSLAFTLDDGTATLLTNGAVVAVTRSQEIIASTASTSAWIEFTFVGSGIDFLRQDYIPGATTSETWSVLIDGTSVGSITGTAQANALVQKVASGLPYGTHTLRIQYASGATAWNLGIRDFIVYQPKKPSLPSGAMELADYNVLANFVAGSAGTSNVAAGVLRKNSAREFIYSGTYTQTLSPSTVAGGWNIYSTTVNDSIQYTFFGTGFDIKPASATANTFTISVDGSTNLSSYTTGVYGTGIALTASTGTVAQTVATSGQGVYVSGLSLGLHTVKFTKNAGASNFAINVLDIITPIHSHKINLYSDLQNTLPVGLSGISDNRKFTPVKDGLPALKSWAVAQAVTAAPTTTSGVLVPCPDMSCAVKTNSGVLDISYSAVASSSAAGSGVSFAVFVDGVQVGALKSVVPSTAAYSSTVSDRIFVPVNAGVHKVDVYWVAGATATAGNRTLVVKEF